MPISGCDIQKETQIHTDCPRVLHKASKVTLGALSVAFLSQVPALPVARSCQKPIRSLGIQIDEFGSSDTLTLSYAAYQCSTVNMFITLPQQPNLNLISTFTFMWKALEIAETKEWLGSSVERTLVLTAGDPGLIPEGTPNFSNYLNKGYC